MTGNDQAQGRPTVVVVGGGYGGVNVAKALDEWADVALVEPRDAFMHNVAALRALVDPSWLPRIYIPYDNLLANGRVVRDRAALVEPGRVVTASGEEILADYVVLATGSSYPFPAKTDKVDTEAAHDQVRAAHLALSQADRVLLLGAGPVGIELAGEIGYVWPEKAITLLDLSGEVLGGPFKPELKAELHRQLTEAGVDVVLGSPLNESPTTAPGELETFTVKTEDGIEITADIWFQCFGVVPNSDYLGEALLGARGDDGFVEVEPTLQVVGHDRVFALGDLSTADAKMAGSAAREAGTVAANITALANGAEPTAYQPMGTGIVVPIGPLRGAGQFPGQEEIVGPDVISEVKGRDMMVDRFQELFNLAVAVAE
ncbi:MAG TPA: FAD-dependent oxidoreductase [Acidimicrobiales bacterium]